MDSYKCRSTRVTVGQIGYLVYYYFFFCRYWIPRVEFRFRDLFTRIFFLLFPVDSGRHGTPSLTEIIFSLTGTHRNAICNHSFGTRVSKWNARLFRCRIELVRYPIDCDTIGRQPNAINTVYSAVLFFFSLSAFTSGEIWISELLKAFKKNNHSGKSRIILYATNVYTPAKWNTFVSCFPAVVLLSAVPDVYWPNGRQAVSQGLARENTR